MEEDGEDGLDVGEEQADSVGSGPEWDEREEQLIVAVSAVEHYSYCPRQCALIHVEQTFEENLYTVRGKLAHERVDSGVDTAIRGVRTERSLPLRSVRLGLRGKADVVEFQREGPYPVEYKVGRRHGIHADLQLCAQALCLEEMLGVPVPRGALFYYATRTRHEVVLGNRLRQLTLTTIDAVRAMLRDQVVPAPANDGRCRNCSLIDACLPDVVAEPARLRGLQAVLFRVWDGQDEEWGVE